MSDTKSVRMSSEIYDQLNAISETSRPRINLQSLIDEAALRLIEDYNSGGLRIAKLNESPGPGFPIPGRCGATAARVAPDAPPPALPTRGAPASSTDYRKSRR